MSTTRIGPNDLLLSQTTVSHAARLLVKQDDNDWGLNHSTWFSGPIRLGFLRLLELCSLIEAIVLHDTLFTLPASLPDDVPHLELRKHLIKEGILKEYPLSLVRQQPPSELEAFTIEWRSMFKNYNYEHAWDDSDSMQFVSTVECAKQRFGNDDRELIHNILEQMLTSIQTAPSALKGFVGHDNRSAFRTIFYWQVADQARLPWYPNVLRLSALLMIKRHLRSSLADQVYRIVADAFRGSIEEVSQFDLPNDTMIPALSYYVLSSCNGREEVTERILDVRREFTDFRRNFRHIEDRKRQAKTLKELNSVNQDRRGLLEAVASRYRGSDQTMFDTLLGYAPDIIKPLVKPYSPESSAKLATALAKKPAKWIRSWWCRRPASRLFSLSSKLQELDVYRPIASKLFGIDIGDKDAESIQWYWSKTRELMEPVSAAAPDVAAATSGAARTEYNLYGQTVFINRPRNTVHLENFQNTLTEKELINDE